MSKEDETREQKRRAQERRKNRSRVTLRILEGVSHERCVLISSTSTRRFLEQASHETFTFIIFHNDLNLQFLRKVSQYLAVNVFLERYYDSSCAKSYASQGKKLQEVSKSVSKDQWVRSAARPGHSRIMVERPRVGTESLSLPFQRATTRAIRHAQSN